MLLLCVGLILFIAFHLIPTNAKLRAGLAGKFGDVGVKGVVALGALVGFVLIIYGYGKMQGSAKNPVIWDPPIWTQHITLLLMAFSMIALAATYIPSRIQSMLKHPMLLAVKIWALGHLLANGDVASILLFGSLLAWAVYDRISLKKRGNLGPGPANVSILNDLAVVLLGLALYAGMVIWGHEYLIGVGVIG